MSVPSIEPDPAAAAYESIADELAALRPRELLPVNVDLSRVASRAIRAAPRIREYLPQIERQLPELPVAPIQNLQTYALAAWYAHARSWHIRSLSTTKDLVARAKPLRAKLLKAAEVFSDAGFTDAAHVATIRGGQGRLDMAKDMIALTHILQKAWGRIGPNALVTPEDLRNAGELGEELMNALAEGETEVRAKRTQCADRCARTFTLLYRAYDTAQRAIVFLRWHEKDASRIAPSLFVREPGRRRKTSRESSVDRTEAPQTSAESTTEHGGTETATAAG